MRVVAKKQSLLTHDEKTANVKLSYDARQKGGTKKVPKQTPLLSSSGIFVQ